VRLWAGLAGPIAVHPPAVTCGEAPGFQGSCSSCGTRSCCQPSLSRRGCEQHTLTAQHSAHADSMIAKASTYTKVEVASGEAFELLRNVRRETTSPGGGGCPGGEGGEGGEGGGGGGRGGMGGDGGRQLLQVVKHCSLCEWPVRVERESW
jgi:hypothetical protein